MRHISLNVGTVLFGILFVYILICVLIFVTTKHVRSFQVVSGPLAKNETYTGVAIYNEQVINADAAGYVNYYAAANAKIRKGGIVYGISPERKSSDPVRPGDETLSEVRKEADAFVRSYQSDNFTEVYSLKYAIAGEIMNASVGSNPLAGSIGSITIGSEIVNTAPEAGIISYSTDGYENVDYKKLPADFFDEKQYHHHLLRSEEKYEAGEPVYKLIVSEDWSLIIPLTARQTVRLGDLSEVRVKFLKDGVTTKAGFSILTGENNAYYGKLDFSNGLMRYLDSRFIDVELVTNTDTGLKIPVSSIVRKEFYTVPDTFASYEGDTKTIGFLKQETDRTGVSTTTFTTTTIYAHENGRYYIDNSAFTEDDVILKEGSKTDRYIIRDTETLEGVYSMNKGYAVFRRIDIITKNEEYCLVDKGTSYGIAQFDNIVADASTVRESQITAR